MPLDVKDPSGNLVLTNSLYEGMGIDALLPGDENSGKRADIRVNLDTLADIIIKHIQDHGDVINISCTGTIPPGGIVTTGSAVTQTTTTPVALNVSGTGSIL